MRRRTFLKGVALAGTGAVVGARATAAQAWPTSGSTTRRTYAS
jgi:gas vesicle protein